MTEEKIHSLVSELICTMRMHRKVIDATVVNNIGIHRLQHQVLMKLSREDKFKSQKEIAEQLGITQAAMTGALSKLEADGLIARSVGSDSRFNEISITEKGREIVEQTRKYFSKVDAAAFLGIDDGMIDNFSDCLTCIRENLEKLLEGDTDK